MQQQTGHDNKSLMDVHQQLPSAYYLLAPPNDHVTTQCTQNPPIVLSYCVTAFAFFSKKKLVLLQASLGIFENYIVCTLSSGPQFHAKIVRQARFYSEQHSCCMYTVSPRPQNRAHI